MQIYADNAATTKTRASAIEAMIPYFRETFGNPSSLNTPGQLAKEALTDARTRLAKILNSDPSEIYFTSGGSESDNQAINSAAIAGAKKGKKHIISSAFEHHAVLHTLKNLEKQGFEVTLLDVHKNGMIHLEELEAAIRPDTALVTIMFANNEIGSIQPITEIGKLCREKGITFHTDAVQAVGHIDVDVQSHNVDMLSFSAHKFGGPKGIGALYCKKGIPLSNLIEGGAQERNKRAGTENLPAIVGMATALEEATSEMKELNPKLTLLRDKLIKGLLKVPHSILNGDPKKRLPGNVHVCFEGIEGEALLLMLDEKGIYASSGSACTSGSLDPSHVLLAIGHPHAIAHGSLRLSLSDNITEQEIDYMIQEIPKVVAYLRNMSPVWKDLVTGKKDFMI
ncbi:MAG: cysteine desulfurase NifS [Treponema sp. CETP13]|nr:MAG: cysteine desulfurase NifS [Treponema sp. CETP13]